LDLILFFGFPLRAINLHCLNVVVDFELFFLFYFIEIYNIYGHKLSGRLQHLEQPADQVTSPGFQKMAKRVGCLKKERLAWRQKRGKPA